MAFRNIFRNKRRTTLTVISTFIGILGITVGLGWVYGVERMFTEEGKRVTGVIRVTSTDFELKEKSLDTSSNIILAEVRERLDDFRGINLGRIKFGGLVFKGEKDERALGTGIEERDYETIGFDSFIYSGRFLDFNNSGEVLVGDKIREKLDLELGEEITILTSTQDRSISVLNYEIIGFYKMDNSQLNRSFYITLADAEYLLDMEGAVTEFLLYPQNEKQTSYYKGALKKNLGDDYLIKSWDEIGLNQYMSSLLPFVKIVFAFILTLLSGVGISNTMMMVVFERKKEVGILKSQGMREGRIRALFCLEGVIIGIAGSSAGISLGGALVYYFSKEGIPLRDVFQNISGNLNIKSIIYMSFRWEVLLFAFVLGVTVSLMATLISVNPELKKKAVENLRN